MWYEEREPMAKVTQNCVFQQQHYCWGQRKVSVDLWLKFFPGQGQAPHHTRDMGDLPSAAASNLSAVCFQMPLALRQEMSQPFQERKEGLCSYSFLPGIITARVLSRTHLHGLWHFGEHSKDWCYSSEIFAEAARDRPHSCLNPLWKQKGGYFHS